MNCLAVPEGANVHATLCFTGNGVYYILGTLHAHEKDQVMGIRTVTQLD